MRLVASDARDPRAAALVPLHRARRAALADRFEEAHALVDGVAASSDQLKGSTIPMTVASQRLALAWIQGGPRAIGEQVRAWAEAVPAMPVWRAALTAALADEGRVAEAQLEFDRLASDGFSGLPRDNLWFVAMALLAEAAGPLGDQARARELHALLAPFSGRNVVAPTAAFLGSVDMWLGVLAGVAGDSEEALPRLAAARGAASRQRAPRRSCGSRSRRRRSPSRIALRVRVNGPVSCSTRPTRALRCHVQARGGRVGR